MGQGRKVVFLVWTCVVLLLSMPFPAWAQEAPPAAGTALPAGTALDLASTQATMAAQNAQPVNIYTNGSLGANGAITGGVAQTVNPGQMVTPAQYMAISQVMSGAQQTLVLSAAGAAAAGFASVSPATMTALQSLSIPAGVSLNSIGFNAATAFNVAGAATVNGALYAMQQSQAATAVLNLGSLLVGPGAMVTTNLPSYSAMLGNVVASSGLTMNIAGTLTNYGTIATAGPLSVLAGGAIYNQTLAGMPQASMIAQSVAMSSLASTIVNSGIITALSGNISMASQLASNLSVLNTGGVLQALNGSINFRSSDFTGKFHLDVVGGDLLAQQLNLYSGSGIVNLYANDVTGRVNISAGEAHVTAATSNLVLGNMNLSGDPTFYNTNPLGDVTIAGDLIFSGQDLAIVANRNVLTAAGANIIDTSSTSTKGGSVTIVAGANFTATYTPSGGAPTSYPGGGLIVNPATPIANDQNLVLQITGPSTNGGRIDLATGAPITVFSTQSSAAYPNVNATGGNVTLVAFQGLSPADPDAGTIKLPVNLTITTGGGVVQPPAAAEQVFPSGNFLAIAGGPNSGGGPAIVMGSVDTRNTAMPLAPSQTPGGSVLVHAATPILAGSAPVIIQGGTIINGSFVPQTTQYHNSMVALKNVWSTGAVQIVSGGSVTVSGMLYTLPNFANVGFPTDILLAAGVGPTSNSATLSIGNIATNGNSLSLISSAAIVSASGHSSLNINTFDTFSTGHTPIGTINLLAGVMAIPTAAPSVAIPQLVQVGVPAASSFAGVINFSVPTTFTSGPGVTPGGNITMLSSNGVVTLNPGSTIASNGGNIVIMAGSTTNLPLPNCSICLGSVNAGSGSIFIATEQPILSGPAFFGPISANIGVNNINPTAAVPVLDSSISFAGSLNAGTFITVLAGRDIGFPAVSFVTTSGSAITLAAGINQDPGTTLAPYTPVNPGALVLGANLADESVSALGGTPQVTLVAGLDLTVPGTVIANGGQLGVIVTGSILALPTTASQLKITATDSASLTTLQSTATQLFAINVGNTFTLNAQAPSSSITQTATLVSANTLDLTAGSGGINLPNINAGTLKFSTTGSVNWTDINTTVNLDLSNIAGTMIGIASNTGSTIGQVASTVISVNTLVLSAGSGGITINNTDASTLRFSTTGSVSWTDINPSVTLGTSTITGTMTGNASSPGSSIDQVFGSVITANGLNLTIGNGSGDIDLTNTRASNLQFHSNGGSVTIQNSVSDLTISADSTASFVSIDNATNIFVANDITALSGGLMAGGSITGAGVLVVNELTLDATTGNINVTTQSSAVGVSSPLDITVANSGSLIDVSINANTPNSLTVTNDNDIQTSLALTSVSSISFTTTDNDGDISLGASLFADDSIILSADGSGNITSAGSLSADSIDLTSGSGNIGPLQTSVLALTANIGGAGALTVNNFGYTPLALGPVSAQTIVITNDADINVTGVVSATGSVSLTTTSGSNGNIILDAPVGDQGALVATVTLTADGGILNGNSSPLISGQSVNLTSAAAIIGTPLSHLQVTARTLSATPFPPGTNNVDWICCSPAPTPAPVQETESENTSIPDLIAGQEETAKNDNSVVNGDGSPAVTPTDATPQSHDVPIDLTNPVTNLNLGAESSEQMQTGIPGAAASGNATPAELQSQGVHIGAGSTETYMILNQGNVLFQPNHDMTVQVQEGHVFIPDGAVAFVIETGHDVAVFDMHDGKKGSVRVKAGNRMVTLSPGKQLVLTRQLEADFNEINPEKLIAHRNVQTVATTEGIRIYSADFSLPSMMMNVSPIKRMLASDNPAERRQARKLLKNAVVLAQLSGQKGPYNNSGSSH